MNSRVAKATPKRRFCGPPCPPAFKFLRDTRGIGRVGRSYRAIAPPPRARYNTPGLTAGLIPRLKGAS